MPGLDEFGLIRLLTSGRNGGTGGREEGVAVGIGDDAAVLNGRLGCQWAVSCDTMVQDVHFKAETMTFADVGFKAMASNISDMAAMGAEPRFALAALSVPKNVPESSLQELYTGLYECADKYGVVVVGGDTTGSPGGLVLTVTVLGEVEAGRALLRSGAKPGDTVFITGPLGLSAAGLHVLLQRGKSAYEREGLLPEQLPLITAHQRPLPQVEAGRLLLASGLGRSLNDVSDGLASEAWELAEASGCTLELREELLPMPDELAAYGAAAGMDPLDWLLYGGEDYQLVGTARAEEFEELSRMFGERGLTLHPIGQSVEAEDGKPNVRLISRSGTAVSIGKRGYNHFA